MKALSKAALTIGTLGLVIAACDSGSSSDPATVSRDALNPPSGLYTVTNHNSLELRWKAANAEDEFKGFHVFAVKGSTATLAAVAPTFPKQIVPAPTLTTGSFPRCLDNTKLFEAFGFAATDSDCEGDAEAPAATTGAASTAFLQEPAATPAIEEKLENFIPCKENTANPNLSLPGVAPLLTLQTCTITQYFDPTSKKRLDMKDGETYTVFVSAVAGDELSDISWTSNFVSDTPSTRLFEGTLSLKVGEAVRLPVADIVDFTKTVTALPAAALCSDVDPDTTDANNNGQVCRINRFNKSAADGLWFGRLGTGEFPQRMFFSTVAGGDVSLALRGPQTQDPKNPNIISVSIPSDQAAAADVAYVADGTHFPIYGNQVFDLKVKKAGATHYGKVVFYSAEPLPANASDPISLKVAIVMQPAAGVRDYLQ